MAGLSIAALCLLVGGWPWALISLVALAWLARGEFDAAAMLLAASLSLLWLTLFFATGDRRLFFPFSIQFALQVAFARRAAIPGCACTLAAFLLIRIAQGATLKVLLVELAVAAMALAVSLAAYGRSSRGWPARIGWSGFGSFLAFLGLAL